MTSLIGKKAPAFKAKAVAMGDQIINDFTLEQYIGKKYVVFFFYPKDFTFVCPTELHAFQHAAAEFEKRNVSLVACSTDTEESHWGWLQTTKEQGGIKGVMYPIVADTSKIISIQYGVLSGEYKMSQNGEVQADGAMIALRGLFLIDKKGVVRHSLINDFPLGRNVDEALRMVDALQYFEEVGEVCPANWKKGEKALEGSHSGVAKYLASTK